MTDKLYLITEEQRENYLQIMRNNMQDPDAYEAITELQSLPVVDNQPVGIVVHKPKMLRVGALNREGLALPDGTKLYTSPQALKQITELEAQLADAKKANQWQPIETAPQGCSILCGTAGVKYSVAEAFFHNGAWCCWDGINNTRTYMVSPTHWKPIPKEPTIDAAMAEGKA